MRIGIIGGSGFTGGELLRLLLFHPEAEVCQVTSNRFAGKPVKIVHPNLRKVTDLKFTSNIKIDDADLLFLCLPHGTSMKSIQEYLKASGRIIDLSGDFRLRNPDDYRAWYGEEHAHPALLEKFIYGIPELHRDEMRRAKLISSAGCNATAVILGLHPLFREGVVDTSMPVVSEAKCGSSEGGNKPSEASHHPVRANCVRSYRPVMHRHTGEMVQELGIAKGMMAFSATSIDSVRGILATSHVFLKEPLDERDVWQIYRKHYSEEPFIRIVKEKTGSYRYPEPKILSGTNYCDIGFERDESGRRLVVISAIDNLMKGAAGQAVQCFNIMNGFEERLGLEFPGLHPI